MKRIRLTLILFFSVSTLMADNTISNVFGGNDFDLRNYISHIVNQNYFLTNATSSVYINQLPPDLPITIQFPPTFNIIGCIVQNNDQYIDIILDSNQDLSDIISFFDSIFSDSKWKKENLRYYIGGFQPQPININYCYKNEISINIALFDYSVDSVIDIRMHIQTGKNIICNTEDSILSTRTDPYFLIPYLSPPPNVIVKNNSGGGSSNGPFGPYNVFQSAILETNSSIISIFNYYSDQLKKNYNWIQNNLLCNDNIAWSTWYFPTDNSEERYGILYLTSSPLNTNEVIATIQIISN